MRRERSAAAAEVKVAKSFSTTVMNDEERKLLFRKSLQVLAQKYLEENQQGKKSILAAAAANANGKPRRRQQAQRDPKALQYKSPQAKERHSPRRRRRPKETTAAGAVIRKSELPQLSFDDSAALTTAWSAFTLNTAQKEALLSQPSQSYDDGTWATGTTTTNASSSLSSSSSSSSFFLDANDTVTTATSRSIEDWARAAAAAAGENSSSSSSWLSQFVLACTAPNPAFCVTHEDDDDELLHPTHTYLEDGTMLDFYDDDDDDDDDDSDESEESDSYDDDDDDDDDDHHDWSTAASRSMLLAEVEDSTNGKSHDSACPDDDDHDDGKQSASSTPRRQPPSPSPSSALASPARIWMTLTWSPKKGSTISTPTRTSPNSNVLDTIAGGGGVTSFLPAQPMTTRLVPDEIVPVSPRSSKQPPPHQQSWQSWVRSSTTRDDSTISTRPSQYNSSPASSPNRKNVFLSSLSIPAAF
ncbi:hypothetical protein ACA910_014303 [Epithemia clementina (nom. ined.)]